MKPTFRYFLPALAAGFLAVTAFALDHEQHAGEQGLLALDVYAQGKTVDLLLAVAQGAGENVPAVLQHRRSLDGGRTWSAPVALPTAGHPPHSPHRGSDPQLAADGDRLVALWTTPGSSRWGSGPLASAWSQDGGKTWTAGPNPADDASTNGLSTDGHGYIDVAADGAGAFHAVWLDSRDGEQGLRAARSTDGGHTWQPNRTIDARTCECCWNRLLATPKGTWVIYRDKDPRDLAVAESRDGGASWARLATAGAFDWRIEACPHNGGAMAVGAAGLTALTWTGAEGKSGLYALGSTDGGKTWSEPHPLPDQSAHRGDLAASGAALLAVWDGFPVEGRRSIRASLSTDGGKAWQASQPVSAAGVSAEQPRVVAVEGGFLVVWSEKDAGGSTRLGLARVALAGGGTMRLEPLAP